MKIEFTIHSHIPLSFIAEVVNDAAAWRLLGILAEGQKWPVTHRVIRPTPYVPEQGARWPTGPLLEDM